MLTLLEENHSCCLHILADSTPNSLAPTPSVMGWSLPMAGLLRSTRDSTTDDFDKSSHLLQQHSASLHVS